MSWTRGEAHTRLRRMETHAHLLRLRLGPGAGIESTGLRLHDIIWPAGAVEYLPPKAEFEHATVVGTDWVSVALTEAEWEQVGMRNLGRVACSDHRVCAALDLRAIVLSLLACQAWESVAMRVVDSVLTACQGDQPNVLPRALSDRQVKKVFAYVEASLHQEVSLAMMAAQAGVSKFHFVGAFKRAVGMTPHQYLMHRRLERGRGLLGQASMRVTDIAYECGFSSHAHFTSAFKGRYGVAPGALRVQA